MWFEILFEINVVVLQHHGGHKGYGATFVA
jgi:hypothetical protein